MALTYTRAQKQRLIELGADEDVGKTLFETEKKRDITFKNIHDQLVSKSKDRLQRLRNSLRPAIRILETRLIEVLNHAGFVEVSTPITVSDGMLGKMGIQEGHPLREQIYRLHGNVCLRPMLAPNLYYLLGRLEKKWSYPIRIFEIGPCFRKESKGARHLSEFTMLNLVELGIDGLPETRLIGMADLVMEAAGVPYELCSENSEVYGDTIDIMVEGLEIASGATGPHPLDANWDIAENWAGLGFGLERLVMIKEGFNNIRRAGRSLIYLDGARLNI